MEKNRLEEIKEPRGEPQIFENQANPNVQHAWKSSKEIEKGKNSLTLEKVPGALDPGDRIQFWNVLNEVAATYKPSLDACNPFEKHLPKLPNIDIG